MDKPTLSGYIIALLELLEAEGRTLKSHIIRVAITLLLVIFAGITLLFGLGFLLFAFYNMLTYYVSFDLAALIVGLGTISLSVLILGWVRWRA